jgi:SAM-dependent methyltransferase
MYCVEDQHWWFVTRRMIIKKILDTFLQQSITPDILEAGCGTGGNLELLSSYGNIHAIEIDGVARDLANKRDICSVKTGSLPEDIPFTKYFNLICVLDVLERIDDDLAAMKAIVDKIKNNGKLLITVPAYMFMWGSHDITLHHKRRYTKKQLTSVVQAAGMEIIYATYFNTYLFL